MAEIKALVRDHLPDDLGAPFDRPCHIEIVGLFTGIPVDADNIFSKPYVDALIGPVIVDDSPDYVVSVKRSSYRSSVDLVEIRAYMQKERKGTR